jgi:gamma-glutamyltranspeptidase/glutathione hydrolase
MARTPSVDRVSRRHAVAGSEGHAAAAARRALEKGGNAVDAVAAAVLAAAVESAGVFLGPLQLLVAGGGAGILAIDGRVRQPGLGVPRPRGFLGEADVPAVARVGVAGLPFALATAHAALGDASLLTLAKPVTTGAASPERAATIERFARRGSSALTEGGFVEEVVGAAGRAAGGQLTRDDLAAVRPGVLPHKESDLEEGFFSAPWSGPEAHDARDTHVVAAADGRGLVCVACYEAPHEGLALPALGLTAPFFAAPVKRGEPRVRPGEPRAAAAPIALRVRRGVVELAFGVALATDAEAQLQAILRAVDEAPTFQEALGAGGSGRVVAVARSRDVPVALRSA